MGQQHLAGSIIPAIQIKRVLIEEKLSVYQEAEVPRKRMTIQFQSLEAQTAVRTKLFNDGQQEVAELRPGASAFPSQQRTAANVMEQEIVEMLPGFRLGQKATKGYVAGLL